MSWISEDDIKKAEDLVKSETGKEFVMIAWEKIK